MAGVIFHWEPYDIDVFSGTKDAMTAWNHAIKLCEGIKNIIIVSNMGNIPSIDADLNVQITSEVPVLPNMVKLVCPWDKGTHIPLWEYKHTADWYVFGPSNGWDKTKDCSGVTVPMNGKGAPHAVHVAHIVFAHRNWVI